MADARDGGRLAGPGIMLLSAAIFGYFGFAPSYVHHGQNGQLLLYVPLLEWTLKSTAMLFAIAAGLTFVRPRAGNLIYAVVGLLGAVCFVIVAILDWRDPLHTVMSPILLLLFAAWNGYGSWVALQALRRRPTVPDGADGR